jgi:diacylglycerol kinase (ATP)
MTKIKFLKSLLVAIQGIFHSFLKERNLKIQVFIGLLVIIISIFLGISKIEFVIILFIIFFVIILELLNSCFENFIDLIFPEYNKKIGKLKDVMAGTVLLSSVLSVIIGFLILYRPAINFLKNIQKFPLFNLLVIDIFLFIAIILVFYFIGRVLTKKKFKDF